MLSVIQGAVGYQLWGEGGWAAISNARDLLVISYGGRGGAAISNTRGLLVISYRWRGGAISNTRGLLVISWGGGCYQ